MNSLPAIYGIPSGFELLVIVVLVAALFFPKRLTGMAKSLGKAKGAYDDGKKTGRDAKKALAESLFPSGSGEERAASDEIVEVEPEEP